MKVNKTAKIAWTVIISAFILLLTSCIAIPTDFKSNSPGNTITGMPGNAASDAPKAISRRDQLAEPVRDIYDMLLSAVEKIGEYEWDSVRYGATAFSDFMAADEALRADYPRFRAYYYPDVTGDVFRPVYFLPGNSYDTPTDNRAEIVNRMSLFDAVCQRIIDCMPTALSDTGKYRYFAAVITELC